MTPFGFRCVVLCTLLLLVGGQPAQGQDAFLNEFHTDDQNGGYLDANADGQPDSYTDLEFVEFALRDGAPFTADDVIAILYDGSGTYAGYAIGDPLWEVGEQQGNYRLYAYGPFRIPIDSAPGAPERGALPDGHGAIALARWTPDDTLELLDLVSYGGLVTLTDDPWFGTVAATSIPVSERPAPASDTSGLNLYALGLAGVLGGQNTTRHAATLRVRSGAAPLPGGTDSMSALATTRVTGRLASAGRAPMDLQTAHRSFRQPSTPHGLNWMVFANTATPGQVNGNQTLPVELTAFEVTLDDADAVLTWQTSSETNNAGFYVEHAHHTQPFREVGFVSGAGTTTRVQTYRFRVSSLPPGTHTFRLRQVDTDGQFAYTQPRTVQRASPRALYLARPTPHPVTGPTTLTLTADAAQSVRVALFDLMGRQVAVLHDGPVEAHAVYDISLDPARAALSSGTYFIRAVGERHRHTQRIVVVR